MNKKNAKAISLKEALEVLPKWWTDNLNTVLSIAKHSKFTSFKKAETFFSTALSFIPDKESSEFKHILIDCENKGEQNSFFYITIIAYFRFKDKEKGLWKMSKSLHVKKREKILSYD